jgi:hypothetical protein
MKNPNDRGFQGSNINCVMENAEGRILKLIMQDDLFVNDQALEKIKQGFDDDRTTSGCFTDLPIRQMA